MKRLPKLLAWLAIFACAGCGDAAGIAVSGTVTQAGQPVKIATILFRPAKGTKGPEIRAKVTDGRYQVAPEKGLQSGKYELEISLTEWPPDKAKVMQSGAKRIESHMREHEIKGKSAQINVEL